MRPTAFCGLWKPPINEIMTQTKKTILLIVVSLICACFFFFLMLTLYQRKNQDPPQATEKTTAQTVQTTQTETTENQTESTALQENVFSPGDFGYEGDYLTCLTAPCIRGIDVSTHQKKIDWKKVKKAGFDFVMIRLGYRGSIEGVLFEDEWAQRNYKGAKAAGLKVGGYFFSQSISPEEAIEEALYCMEIVKDWDVEMPLVYDWEYIKDGYRTDVVDARLLTECTKAFCDTVEKAGYDSMLYFNPTLSRKQMYMQELSDYGFWLALYSDEMTYEHKVDMWQYTNQGNVPGINGNVDINLYFPTE